MKRSFWWAVVTIAVAFPGWCVEPGFTPLFDGKTLKGWTLVGGTGRGYVVEDGLLVCPADGGGKLMTEDEFANFVLRFEYRLEPGANNGINIRAPLEGRPAYVGMEIQILDDSAEKWKALRSEQRNGSVYDLIPARTGFAHPPGQWNEEEIVADGRRVRVTLNGVLVLDANLDMVKEAEVLEKHPGLKRTGGHLGLLGHKSRAEFRNIRVRRLPAPGAGN